MENLHQITSDIGQCIVDKYKEFLSTAAQDFILYYEDHSRTVHEYGDEEIITEFNAARNTQSYLWSSFLLLETQEELYTKEEIMNCGLYERFHNLLKNFDEDVQSFIKYSQGKVL